MKHTLLILLGTVLLAACGNSDNKADKTAQLAKLKKERAALDQQISALEASLPASKNTNSVPVRVLALTPQTFSATIDVQASVIGNENVLASSQSPGVITKINVQLGQRVSKGQVLAHLDAAAIDQSINAQEAQLNLLKQLYEKQQKLWAQNIGTQVQLLQAKAAFDAATSQRAAMIAQKNMFVIKSPINGVVDDIPVKVGDMSSPGMNGIRVVSKDKLKAQAKLGESYLGKVQQGDAVKLLFADGTDSMNTQLHYVAQAVDPISRSFLVEIQLPGNSKMHPNMSAALKIANYRKADAIVIPVSVIQKTNEGELAYIVEGGKAKAVSIQTGRISNGNAEVLSGLKAGDQLVVEGFNDLDNGESVELVK